jgi:hypothetical protein
MEYLVSHNESAAYRDTLAAGYYPLDDLERAVEIMQSIGSDAIEPDVRALIDTR